MVPLLLWVGQHASGICKFCKYDLRQSVHYFYKMLYACIQLVIMSNFLFFPLSNYEQLGVFAFLSGAPDYEARQLDTMRYGGHFGRLSTHILFPYFFSAIFVSFLFYCSSK
jgi:hypothetical protein